VFATFLIGLALLGVVRPDGMTTTSAEPKSQALPAAPRFPSPTRRCGRKESRDAADEIDDRPSPARIG
jgi:hypothetical protein